MLSQTQGSGRMARKERLINGRNYVLADTVREKQVRFGATLYLSSMEYAENGVSGSYWVELNTGNQAEYCSDGFVEYLERVRDSIAEFLEEEFDGNWKQISEHFIPHIYEFEDLEDAELAFQYWLSMCREG